MSTSRKKVVLRSFLPGPLWGYLPAANLLLEDNPRAVGLLDLSGRVQPIELDDIKYVCFVRDFNTSDSANPERLARKTFVGRPRSEGLLLRLTLRDGDLVEGLAALDSSFADGWLEDRGVYLTPPDIRGNTQRLFVPRAAITSFEMVAVVTTPSRRKRVFIAAAQQEQQPELFSLQLHPDVRTN